MKKKLVFLMVILLGFKLIGIGPSWATGFHESNKLLAQALKDLQQTIIEKIEYDTETTAIAFADAQNIDHSLSLKDIFQAPLVLIEKTINTINVLVNARKLTESVKQVFDSSEGPLQVVSAMMTISSLKQAGENLQIAIDGPAYRSDIEKMLDKAYTESSTYLDFKPEAYKDTIIRYLYAQYEAGPLRIPCKSTDLTRRNLYFAQGTYTIEHNIRERFRRLIDELEQSSLSLDLTKDAVSQIQRIRKAVMLSKGRSQEITYKAYLKDEVGSYTPVVTPVRLGSIAELEKMRLIALKGIDKELKVQQISTISTAVISSIQATALCINTTFKSPETDKIIGTVQKWTIVPSMVGFTASKVFST
ncbi:hypothetical protein J7M02_03285, partial [Candidatus Aerophobetes bacterium]|nr:hypothetical protein [Candidatus Aerophobetes bacterium]